MRGPDRSLPLYAGLAALAGAVFVGDLFTQLGLAIWILYVLPVGLALFGRHSGAPVIAAAVCTALMVVTLLTDAPGIIRWIAITNRICGVVVIWYLAFIARALVNTRNRLETEDWVRGIQAELLEQLQGDRSVQEIGDRAIGVIADACGAAVGAMYQSQSGVLRLTASRGVRAGVDIPETFAFGEGVPGAAVATQRVSVLTDLPASFFAVRSAFVNGTPRHLLVVPLVTDDVTEGVLEIGTIEPPAPRVLDLCARAQHSMAIALRTAAYRSRLSALLHETQRQAENLTIQQEELRVANEELEEQSGALRTSQVQLEEQQAELEATNAQLEVQTAELEQQQQGLLIARNDAERASRYKSEFLANMSHELRTPLNSTLILSKLLAQNKGARLSNEEVRFAETIHSSGTSLLTLINDILDLSKIEAGATAIHPELIGLRDVVDTLERTFQPLASEKGLVLTVDLTPLAPASVVTDAQRLQQILFNLVSNAVKFTDRGGIIVRIALDRTGQVAFEVRDTGVGISADQHAMIFEAFRQADGSAGRRHGGTGLGLSISLQLARLLGGDLRVDSVPGTGSTFTLTLPIEGPPARAATAPPSAPASVAAPRHAVTPHPLLAPAPFEDDRDRRTHPGRLILVVEDDTTFARILFDAAHELDFDCVVASTNDQGMALAREFMPNAILLDVGLPDGSGLTLLDRFKRNPDTRHIPVHVLSVADHTRAALTLGAVGYALKPVEHAQLLDAIRKLEARLDQHVRRVLIVEDDETLRVSLQHLLQMDGVTIHCIGTAREALEHLASTSFDCVILDLKLPDASGFDVLQAMSASEHYSFPPVIIYTGQPISSDDEERLRQYSRSVIIKGARSPERLLAEVTLFLHQVESRLPPEQQRLLRVARERDEFFEGRTLLVVEDDIRNVFALTSVFEPRGATVLIARNGREALERLEQTRPDIVLMDIMMPEMDGLTAMRRIREQPAFRTLPIIALTAKATREDHEQCLAAGANDYLSKPLDVDKLVSLCRVWISR